MRKLSTGSDSTLESYRELSIAFFGKDSKAVTYLDEKIKQQGALQEVIAPESQMIYLLGGIHCGSMLENLETSSIT